MPVATAIGVRYRGRGESVEDLTQVACLALVTAVDGFDPSRGHDFLAYAVPTIRGAVRRHFRDKAWDVRPPRRIQELRAKVEAASERLSHAMGRSPRPSELAADLGVDVEEVAECLASGDWYHVQSLDAPAAASSGSGAELADLLGAEDPALDLVEARVSVQPLLARLRPRERRILILRFYRGWTQQQIGADIGVSQMQVSRLLAAALRQLREQLEADAAA
jgi:RNA polymerase sigma-B factor